MTSALHPAAAQRPVSSRTRALGWMRVVLGVAGILTVALVSVLNVAAGDPRLANTLGYFTNLTNLLAGVVFALSGISTLLGRPASAPLTTARAVATSCLLVVAVIYTVFVPGTGGAPPWVSFLLHLAFPTLALLDWALARDRTPLPWRRLWWVLPYPLAWLTATLVRGATEGWVPYGFLLPERGPAAITLTSLGLLGALLAAGTITWGLSRVPSKFAPGSPTQRMETSDH